MTLTSLHAWSPPLACIARSRRARRGLRASRRVVMRRRRTGGGEAHNRPFRESVNATAQSDRDWLSKHLEHAGACCGSAPRAAALAAALGLATCSAGLGGGLLYDDRALVIENQDLRPSTAWTALIFHDFWGTPLDDARSHTSWRPATVATLKLNFHAHELEPGGYHAVNLVIHASVCAMVVLVSKRCGIGGQSWQPSVLCGLLFAVHPVHGTTSLNNVDWLPHSTTIALMICRVSMDGDATMYSRGCG